MLTGRMNLWTPYTDLRREIDRLFESFTGDGHQRGRTFPPVNVWEEGDTLFLEAELPGVKQDDLDISAVGNELTIRGKRSPGQDANLAYHRQERGFGEFTRVLTLPSSINADKIEATLKDGVLTLMLPKAEEAKARKIKVRAD